MKPMRGPHLILTMGLLAALPASAQRNYKRAHNTMLDDAKFLLAEGQYLEASKVYRRLLPVDTSFIEVYYELALCELKLPGHEAQAVSHLRKCVAAGHTEATYQLALAEHRRSRFDEELALLTRYRTMTDRLVDDAEVDRRAAMARTAKEMVAQPVDVRIRNLGPLVNSPEADYAPVLNAEGTMLYFTSRREGSTGAQHDPSGRAYEDIYHARHVDDQWTNAVNVGLPLNSYGHDATVGLSADGGTMIIYRTQEGVPGGDLYETRRAGGRWQNPTLMSERINSEGHEPSATLSPDGNEIYFTSDRPGGFGGRDLYRIRRLPNGEWSLPLNLGPGVNTPYDEDAPFLHSDGITLFFSSNGHRTMGGYDIFKAVQTDPDNNAWSEPENMGFPLNTVNDDIYFCLSEDGRTGVFSSERPEGIGGQDIYAVEFGTSRLERVVVCGLVTDAADEPVRARITLEEQEGGAQAGIYNSHPVTGRYVLVVRPGLSYSMKVEAPGFETRTSVLRMRGGAGELGEAGLDIQLTRSEHTARNQGRP